jgi:hypothetical protein
LHERSISTLEENYDDTHDQPGRRAHRAGGFDVRLTDAFVGLQPGRRQERPSDRDLEDELLWLLLEAEPVQRTYIAARAWADTLQARHTWLRAMQRQVAREGVAQSAALRGMTEMLADELADAEEMAQAAEQPLLDWARAWLLAHPEAIEFLPPCADILIDPLPAERRRALLDCAARLCWD